MLGHPSAGNNGSKDVSRKKLHLGRSQSEQNVSSRRPSVNTRRTKSLGTLEYILSKTSSEFEELFERDENVINEIAMGKNLKTVPSQYKERWKQAREVSLKLIHLNESQLSVSFS